MNLYRVENTRGVLIARKFMELKLNLAPNLHLTVKSEPLIDQKHREPITIAYKLKNIVTWCLKIIGQKLYY